MRCRLPGLLTAATGWRPYTLHGRVCWVTSSHTQTAATHSLTAFDAKAAVGSTVLRVISFTPGCMMRRPDKERFVGELARVCEPGGRIIIVTWCHRCAGWRQGAASDVPQHAQVMRGACLHACAGLAQLGWHSKRTLRPHGCRITHRACGSSRASGTCGAHARQAAALTRGRLRRSRAAPRARNLRPGEEGLTADEQALLDRICEAYYLPAWCSEDDYRRICRAQGLQARPRDAC